LNNSQRQFSFKFDPNFFTFLNDSQSQLLKQADNQDLVALIFHVYACILNEFSINNTSNNQAFNSNLNDNLLRAIRPQIIDQIFAFFTQEATESSDFYFLALYDNQSVLLNKERFSITDEKFQLVADFEMINKKLFYDRKLLACKCLPLVVNILHLALPDKRLIDVGVVLDKLINSLEDETDSNVKYEFVKCYLSMLDECLDKAAIKIVLVSRRFILCLLEQLRLVVCLSDQTKTKSPHLVNEFVYIVMSLFKNLLNQSQSVGDIFIECDGYQMLYAVLKDTDVLNVDMSILMNEMICEKTFTNRQAVDNLEKNAFSFLDDVRNCEMSVLMIRLVPYMQPVAQEFSLRNICHLCTISYKNIVKSCQNSILFDLIDLLNFHKQIKSNLIGNFYSNLMNVSFHFIFCHGLLSKLFTYKTKDKLFRTIHLLGNYSINNRELKAFIELLRPQKHFPYGLHVLRCLLLWSKHTSSVGFNYNQLILPNESSNDTNNSSATSLNTVSSQQLGSEAKNFLAVETGAANAAAPGRVRRSSAISLNSTVLSNVSRSSGMGALAQNAQQQSKCYFDFQHANSGIRVPALKKWPGYAFTFHAWVKLRSDLELFEKKRRQLYSFYNDYGQGFEAFFTADCSSLVVSVCTKKEFLSVQLRELNFDSSNQNSVNSNQASDEVNSVNNGLTTSTNDFWHAVTIVHVPSKSPFGYSQVLIYIDGVLKKETELKLPNFNDTFNHIRIGAACARPVVGQTSYISGNN
jgi:hypothetical protein